MSFVYKHRQSALAVSKPTRPLRAPCVRVCLSAVGSSQLRISERLKTSSVSPDNVGGFERWVFSEEWGDRIEKLFGNSSEVGGQQPQSCLKYFITRCEITQLFPYVTRGQPVAKTMCVCGPALFFEMKMTYLASLWKYYNTWVLVFLEQRGQNSAPAP
ncbi:hypothetical protein Bbelb_432750, partial [Branchiostoma belcheri]